MTIISLTAMILNMSDNTWLVQQPFPREAKVISLYIQLGFPIKLLYFWCNPLMITQMRILTHIRLNINSVRHDWISIKTQAADWLRGFSLRCTYHQCDCQSEWQSWGSWTSGYMTPDDHPWICCVCWGSPCIVDKKHSGARPFLCISDKTNGHIVSSQVLS